MNNEVPALEIKNLTVEFSVDGQLIHAVNDVSLTLEKKKTLALVGETGAGKTTTALAVMNLVQIPPGTIKSGSVKVNGIDMLNASKRELQEIRGKEVSMIFQDPMTVLNPVFTIGEQIAESVELHEHCSKKAAFEKAKEMLKLVGIPESRANDYPHQFSGGMKQRAVIAVALSCNPNLLLADEPTTALDVTIQAQVLALMKELKDKKDTSMLLITHDLGVVAEVSDYVAVMYAGSIVEQGTIYDIFDHTRHPYTEGLFESLPNIENRDMKLKSIPGLMPDPTNLPEGCPFAPRCRYATEACSKQKPKTIELSKTHSVACIRCEEEGFHIDRRDYNE